MVSSVNNTSSSGSSTTTATNKNTEISKNQFLSLLTAQLKAQTPDKTYDNQQFAAQLAQFSQLEQLTDIKSLLEEQVKTNTQLSENISNSVLPGMLGKSAKASSSSIYYNGESSSSFAYTVPYQISSCTVSIKDSSGNVIRTITPEDMDLSTGDHTLVWDGKNQSGTTVSSGTYTLSVTAKDSKGSTSTLDSYVVGTIKAVKFKSEGTVLNVGGLDLPLENIVDIYN